MKVAEIYRSVQGEGLLTGTDSVFVRTSGCNLRCWFCDTPYASWSPEGDDLSVDEILEQVDEHDCRHVVLTGGEPMLHAEIVPLAAALHQRGSHITIETAGTLDLPVACDLMSISPKLSGSGPIAEKHPRWHQRHERSRHRPEVIRRLISGYDYQLKFVVDTPIDCEVVTDWLGEFPEADCRRVLLMPQGTCVEDLARREEWLVPYCRENSLQYCPRKQIEWYGLARGT